MTSPSERDPDLEAWLDEQIEQEERERFLAEVVRCPSCGFHMPLMGTDMNKPFNQGRFHWSCHNDTCGRMWESHWGTLKERIPEDRDI